MAREIKFRGQSNQGEWIYGYPIIKSYKAWMKDMHDNTTNPRKLYMDYADYRCIEVDKETIGQYTGLKDKNNNEIFEGDILEITGNHKPGKYIVVWDKYRVAWWGKNIKCDKREREHDNDYFQLLGSFQKDITEVIGDIYRNPELLGVE